MVLTKMKETAEAYLGTKVTHAVVTVPACKSGLRLARPRSVSLDRLSLMTYFDTPMYRL